MKLSAFSRIGLIGIDKGSPYDLRAVVDANFAAGRFRFNGSNYLNQAAFLAAIGGAPPPGGAAHQFEIGTYIDPAAPELLPDGNFASGIGAWLGGSATVAAVAGELAITAAAANSPGAYRPIGSLLQLSGKAYQLNAKVRRGAWARIYAGFGAGTVGGSVNYGQTANLTPDTLTAIDPFSCGGFAANSTVIIRSPDNPVTGAGYADDVSIKEALPFKGFKPGEVTALIEARTPPAAGVDRVVFQLDDAALVNAGWFERNFMRLIWQADGHVHFVVSFGGSGSAVEQVNLDLGAVAANTSFGVAFSATADGFRASLVGGSVQTDNAGTFPGIAGMRIGKARGLINLLWTGGTVDRVRVYPYAMGASEFAALVAPS